MSKYRVTRVSWLFDGDKYGFPWREVYSDALYHGQQVVVVSPECDDPCYEALRAWERVEPGLRVLNEEKCTDVEQFAEYANRAAGRAEGDFILLLGSDELVDMAQLLPFLNWAETQLMATGKAVEFYRADFCVSTRWITPIHWPPANQYICQLSARKWFENTAHYFFGDAGEIGGRQGEPIRAPMPILHYHGLMTEDANAEKETNLQRMYQGIPEPDPRIKGKWKRFFGSGSPWSRRKLFEGQHPLSMWPWLARTDMHLQGVEEGSAVEAAWTKEIDVK